MGDLWTGNRYLQPHFSPRARTSGLPHRYPVHDILSQLRGSHTVSIALAEVHPVDIRYVLLGSSFVHSGRSLHRLVGCHGTPFCWGPKAAELEYGRS